MCTSSEMSLLKSNLVLLQRPQVERLKANSDAETYCPGPCMKAVQCLLCCHIPRVALLLSLASHRFCFVQASRHELWDSELRLLSNRRLCQAKSTGTASARCRMYRNVAPPVVCSIIPCIDPSLDTEWGDSQVVDGNYLHGTHFGLSVGCAAKRVDSAAWQTLVDRLECSREQALRIGSGGEPVLDARTAAMSAAPSRTGLQGNPP